MTPDMRPTEPIQGVPPMSSEKNPRVNRLKLLPAQREVLRDMIEETRCQIAFLEGQASILSEQADAMLSARSENNGE